MIGMVWQRPLFTPGWVTGWGARVGRDPVPAKDTVLAGDARGQAEGQLVCLGPGELRVGPDDGASVAIGTEIPVLLSRELGVSPVRKRA